MHKELHCDVRMAARASQDVIDMEKFTKLFTQKSAQIIVQSRQGIKLQTKCNAPQSTVEWFNISVQDCAHVTDAIKRAIGVRQSFSCVCLPLCVEISLRTVDGDEMILEQWVLDLNPQLRDSTVKVRPTVYNRMEMLLKSLISITRIMPAYKLSRKQSPDSYVIQYHVYKGRSNVECLGEEHKQIKVGEVGTFCGTILVTLSYRTKMTMRPTTTQKSDEAIMIKSDHFHVAPDNIKNKRKKEETKTVDLNKPLRAGAFVDTEELKELHDALSLQLPPEPLTWLLAEKEKLKNLEETLAKSSPHRNGRDPDSGEEASSSCCPAGPSASIDMPRSSRFGAEDQKLLKVLNCPFADGSPITDLAQFYRDCINAPQLSESWREECGAGAEDSADALSQQLDLFESSVPEFDSFINSMCSSLTSHNNNSHLSNN